MPPLLAQPADAALRSLKGQRHALQPRRGLAKRGAPCKPSAAGSGKPDKGFFSEVDPTAEVMPMRSGLGKPDFTKRGGRYNPEFIWQTNWVEALDSQAAQEARQEAEAAEAGRSGEGGGYHKGFLRLGSKAQLNDMSVDLSEQLRVRKKSGAQASSSTHAGGALPTTQRTSRPRYASIPVTRVEQRAWERGSGYSKRVMPVAPTNEVDEAAQAAVLAAERARYEQLKADLQLWAAGLTAACLAATCAFYGREVAASYGVGALGGLVYLRLLNRSMDAMGGGVGGALGQPRLLIPVILALGYNRYNQVLADDTGLTLQLLPILLGFFTYKGAVIASQSLELFDDLTAAYRGQPGSSSAQRPGGGPGAAVAGAEDSRSSQASVASVDRAFRSKVLRG